MAADLLVVATASPVDPMDNREERNRMAAAGRRRHEQLCTQPTFGSRLFVVPRPLLEEGLTHTGQHVREVTD
jgi:hypothetical protein